MSPLDVLGLPTPDLLVLQAAALAAEEAEADARRRAEAARKK